MDITKYSMKIKRVKFSDVKLAHQLEDDSYPSDEAASYLTMSYRYNDARELFFGYFENDKLIGFINGTKSNDIFKTEASTYEHISDGQSVCIHSVCVDKPNRKRGIGLKFLKYYMEVVSEDEAVKQIILVCHDELISFFTKAGFLLIGESIVVRGSKKLYDMHYSIKTHALFN